VTTQAEIIEAGVAEWNAWRQANPTIKPVLGGIDLAERDLTGVNFGETDLTGADFFGAVLTDANLKMSSLAGAELSSADMTGVDLYKSDCTGVFAVDAKFDRAYLAEANISNADLRGSRLTGANLTEANLEGTNLSGADLTDATLAKARVSQADLSQSNVAGANILNLDYGDFLDMGGHYFGIRGLDSCYGNALFVRDAQDQDYLETLRARINDTASPTKRRLKQAAFHGWSWIDYGRSLGKPAFYAIVLAMMFGIFYSFDRSLDWGLMDYEGSADSWLSPFYYSIVTYTTLGFGDITPKSTLGEVVVVSEVILGYTTLGLLLAILANRVARQS
jgi:hypothetical protein